MITRTWTYTYPEEKVLLMAQKLGWSEQISTIQDGEHVFIDNPVDYIDFVSNAITDNTVNFIKGVVGQDTIREAMENARIETEETIKQSIKDGITVE